MTSDRDYLGLAHRFDLWVRDRGTESEDFPMEVWRALRAAALLRSEPVGEPVAWRKENPAFIAYTGRGWPPVRYIWTEAANVAAAEEGWVPVYCGQGSPLTRHP